MTSKGMNGQAQQGSNRHLGRSTGGKLIDFGPVIKAGRELVGWALDLAEREVEEYPEDVERVQNTRSLLAAGLVGAPLPEVEADDVLFTVGVLITALDVPCDDLGVMDALEAALTNLRSQLRASAGHAPGCPFARSASGPRASAPAAHATRPASPFRVAHAVRTWMRHSPTLRKAAPKHG